MLAAITLCLTGLAVCLAGTRAERPVPAAVGKVAASAGFLALAFTLGVPWRTPHGAAVLAALVLSAVGDVALIGTSRRAFLGGLIAFLLGHVAYLVAFVQLGVEPAGIVPGAVFMLVLGGAVLRTLRGPSGKLFPAVVAYVAVIGMMVALAGGVATAHRGVAGDTLAAAAVAFAVSDLFVARQRFLVPAFHNRAIGLPLYYGAQLAFAWAASQLGAA